MDRHEIDRYKSLSGKQHEAKEQELRYERRSELERLDGLKKSLQIKLDADHIKDELRAA
jgi:hypothetical protein